MKKGDLLLFFKCIIIVYIIALIGSILTSSNVKSGWYESIKPAITPPNWVFPVVWNILFFMIAFSMFFAWRSAKSKKARNKVAVVFGINLFLNALWSLLFFGMQNPLLGFIDIILVELSIIAMIIVLWRINKTSPYLLIPYLLWVSFASVINFLAI